MSRAWVVERVGRGVTLTEHTVAHSTTAREEILPGPSRRLCNHSPDGFEFGYGGSGPAQLALAIMLRYFDSESPSAGSAEAAIKHYQDFKWQFVATAGPDGFYITEEQIDSWLAGRKKGGPQT